MKKIDTTIFHEIISNTVKKLESNRSILNRLNVFPVPDGDTGNNVFLTMKGGLEAVSNGEFSLKQFSSCFARGLLEHSKGSSGLILSQYFKGFDSVISDHTSFLTAEQLFRCFHGGSQSVYNAIEEPVEGTIITVMKAVSDLSEHLNLKEMSNGISQSIYKTSCQALIEGVQRLDILKAAGTIDSGGYAFILFLEELYMSTSMEKSEAVTTFIKKKQSEMRGFIPDNPQEILDKLNDMTGKKPYATHGTGIFEHNYCFEFFITTDLESSRLSQQLKDYGSSTIVSELEQGYKVHIHTDQVEDIIGELSESGDIYNVKLDDMTYQHQHQHYLDLLDEHEAFSKDNGQEKSGILAIASGDQLAEVMYSLRVDRVIVDDGSSDMSLTKVLTELSAIKSHEIVIIPDSKDHYSRLEQAISLSYKNVSLIKSKTIPEGITGILHFNPLQAHHENIQNATQAVNSLESVEIVKENGSAAGDNGRHRFLALYRDEVILSESSLIEIIHRVIETYADESISLITLYYGSDLSDLSGLQETLNQRYSLIEFEFVTTGQSEPSCSLSFE